MAKQQQTAAVNGQHPTKPFLGSDGVEYRRRADIRMSVWARYIEEFPATLAEERYFVALFMGELEDDTLDLDKEERINRAKEALADWTTDKYFSVRETVFDSIIRPASPKKAESQTST